MNSRETILVDMDGVLADFDRGVTDIIGKHTAFIDREYMHGQVFHDEIEEAIHRKDFFKNLPPVNGAIEGWGRLTNLGYEPVICSSPIATNEFCVDEKYQWIQRHFVPIFGKQVLKTAVFTTEKFRIDGIALIDDKPVIDNADIASWEHIIFDRPYNRKIQTQPRIKDWYDPAMVTIMQDISSRNRQ